MNTSRPDPDSAAMSALARIAAGLFAQEGGELSYGTVKQGVREALVRDPLDSLLVIALGGSYLFYLAEKGKNPKCESFWDALVFVTTCLSVGYDNKFAHTDAGKAIASVVMTIGPALATRALEPPKESAAAVSAESGSASESVELQKAILAKLDEILTAMKGEPASPGDVQAPLPTPSSPI